ncbi:MAG: thiosulfate oxidation carrier complex protein SoxZ [Pseudomonadales bacterium]
MTVTQPNVRIAIPEQAERGSVVEIKTLISHPMESGFRRDQRGERIARNILTRFECHFRASRTAEDFAGEPQQLVFGCDLHPGMAANPFISFTAAVRESGTFKFHWSGEQHVTLTELRWLQVRA